MRCALAYLIKIVIFSQIILARHCNLPPKFLYIRKNIFGALQILPDKKCRSFQLF
eukprot:TRINITY_DN13293_c0_g1_i1.p3 TRINITY_DN13293_c0_g1~~TRINITY_DN13293_c0_g1_i1.p3  ORF type:complete len:55 (+),score=1.98 TRINITY_DN13293_c0_g1_i1:419-583(+)